jgi:pimeloyl-ACP methyl ester carboxylesterase
MKLVTDRVIALLFAVMATVYPGVLASAQVSTAPSQKATVVLVHGAFAGSSSWNGVISRLLGQGYPVVAAANPLRSLKGDSDYVAALLKSIKGPIVLVGHSYGGAVITNAATGNSNVKALVYVAGFAPEAGETALALSNRLPGSTLGPTLAPPVALPNGGNELYIQPDKFPAQFAADVPLAEARLMAATQRPVAESALGQSAGEAAWKTIPSWFIFGTLDKNIPPAVQSFMAKRAGAKKTVEVKGASHVVMVSHPAEVATLVHDAAVATTR